LELVFERIGVDIHSAKSKVASMDLHALPAPQKGDVQRGLLA